ncbi:dihydrodipicolinate synthase family protein [Alkalihalobacillus sp. BA299]|uniref:dihydrodipicolinate synthase family protein n=1 Tax=Alkalihalobacillus sp. BA299 TaxID=2815938 RepID=UPI001AD9838D|nr:dihydrodipicolinate synthase family protein [Alkalihalobacillus sp. BA299]
MKKLYGVTTAMITPFNQDGKVDVEAIKSHTEFLISKGVNCLYPLGTTGEMLRLSVEERKLVASTVVEAARNRVTVFIHVGAMNQEDTISLAKHAHEIGADGIGIVTPIFFSANDRELEEYFVTVSSNVPSDFPIYLYSIPQCAANDITPEVAQKIAGRCENVIGIKYSYPDFLRVGEYLRINNGNFSVLPGADRLFLSALAMGCDGVVSGVSSVYPEPFVNVYSAYIEQKLDEAREAQVIAVQYCETLKNGSNMSYFKEALKLRGINAGFMRAPQLDLTDSEIEALDQQLKRLPPVSPLNV